MQSYVKNGILYKMLQRRAEADEALTFLTKLFLKDLPQFRGKQFTGSSLFNHHEQGVELFQNEGFSIGAYEERTGKIAGGILNEDRFSVPDSELYEHFVPLLHPCIGILERGMKECIEEGKVKAEKGKYFHIFIAGTNSEYREKGIMTELLKISEQVALDHGYDHLVAELFTKEVQNLFLGKAGFTDIKSIPFLSFEMNGEKVFEDIRPFLKKNEENLNFKIVVKKIK